MFSEVVDFYLGSSESNLLRNIRKCYIIKRFQAFRRDDYLLMRISPPFEWTGGNIPNQELEYLIIAARHKGETLFPISKWPISVYVLLTYLSKENLLQRGSLNDDEIILLGWAELRNSEF